MEGVGQHLANPHKTGRDIVGDEQLNHTKQTASDTDEKPDRTDVEQEVEFPDWRVKQAEERRKQAQYVNQRRSCLSRASAVVLDRVCVREVALPIRTEEERTGEKFPRLNPRLNANSSLGTF